MEKIEWKNIVTTKNTEFNSLILRSDMRLTGERPGQEKQALRIGERARYYVTNLSHCCASYQLEFLLETSFQDRLVILSLVQVNDRHDNKCLKKGFHMR